MSKSRLAQQTYRRFFSNNIKSFGFEWLNNPPSQRARVISENPELLQKYQENLEKAGIPSICESIPGGKFALETRFNRSLFYDKLQQVAEETLSELKPNQKIKF